MELEYAAEQVEKEDEDMLGENPESPEAESDDSLGDDDSDNDNTVDDTTGPNEGIESADDDSNDK